MFEECADHKSMQDSDADTVPPNGYIPTDTSRDAHNNSNRHEVSPNGTLCQNSSHVNSIQKTDVEMHMDPIPEGRHCGVSVNASASHPQRGATATNALCASRPLESPCTNGLSNSHDKHPRLISKNNNAAAAKMVSVLGTSNVKLLINNSCYEAADKEIIYLKRELVALRYRLFKDAQIEHLNNSTLPVTCHVPLADKTKRTRIQASMLLARIHQWAYSSDIDLSSADDTRDQASNKVTEYGNVLSSLSDCILELIQTDVLLPWTADQMHCLANMLDASCTLTAEIYASCNEKNQPMIYKAAHIQDELVKRIINFTISSTVHEERIIFLGQSLSNLCTKQSPMPLSSVVVKVLVTCNRVLASVPLPKRLSKETQGFDVNHVDKASKDIVACMQILTLLENLLIPYCAQIEDLRAIRGEEQVIAAIHKGMHELEKHASSMVLSRSLVSFRVFEVTSCWRLDKFCN